MTRTAYREQLDALRTDVIELSDLVCERYDRALSALESGDDDLAVDVIEGDREINTRYLALEHDCIDLLALQQPVAGDLRFVASSFKILTDLERVGDLATNVAAVASSGPVDRDGGPDVVAVGREAGTLLADAMEAYARDDGAACWDVAARDDDLDARCGAAAEAVLSDLVRTDSGRDERTAAAAAREAAWQTLVLVRDVERVGDHAVNVAARTLYAVEHDDSLLF